jgi:hypothetical protein
MQWDDWSYWYDEWEEWDDLEDEYDSAGERAPTARFDDPEKNALDFMPMNLKEYEEFITANGFTPVPMDKTRLADDLGDATISFSGTNVTKYDYKLDKEAYRKAYREQTDYTSGEIEALLNFSSSGGFIGERHRQTTAIKLKFEVVDNGYPNEPAFRIEPWIMMQMAASEKQKVGKLEMYKNPVETADKPKKEPDTTWYSCDGYLAVIWGEGRAGLALSFGSDASGAIIAHGVFIWTDGAMSRCISEVTLKESSRELPMDMSIYDGLWIKEAVPDSGTIANRDKQLIEIKDGIVVRMETNDSPKLTDDGTPISGRLYWKEDAFLPMMHVILADGKEVSIGSGWILDGNELYITAWNYKKQ